MTEFREGFSPKPEKIKPPTQLVLDPEDHNEHVVKPLLARRPTEKRDKAVKKAISEVAQSRFAKPNPLERKGR